MEPRSFHRKLTAILTADVKGYSRLMGEDEVLTIQTLTAYRELMASAIQGHGGRVIDATGDNLLAEFPSAVSGVECAVEIQKELKVRNDALPENRKMQFRIGINLGDVVVEGERIYGDGVNIAARIEGLAEGGGISISGTVYDQVKNKLAFSYEYQGEQTVKNISEPVRVYRLRMEPEGAIPLVAETKRSRVSRWQWIGLGVGAALVVGGAMVIWRFYYRPAPPAVEVASVEEMDFPLPDKPSIAVLPFENLSGDPGQDYLGDGISENIITALSHISEMFVIARNSTFTYKGRPVKIQQVAEELGVRYVLEGSVQKADDRIRVTAQLVDAITGHHLWARRYDRDLKDLFATQDEITLKIVRALRVELTEGEQARMWHTPENFEAWSHFVRAGDFFQRFTKEDNATARELLERTVKLDPGYASAWTTLAWTYVIDAWLGFSESPEESIKQAIELGKKSMMLDDTQPEVHSLWNTIYLVQRQWDKAMAEGKEAITLGPSNALSHVLLAYAMLLSGEFEEAVVLAERSVRLTPYCPNFYLLILAQAYRQAGRYEEAFAIYQKALDRSRKDKGNPLPLLYGLADVCVQLGREEEARTYAAEVLRIVPNFFLESFHTIYPYKDPAHLERILDNLRKAGLPDKAPLPLPEKPSIAVLPFQNLSNDPEQEYFADGITEDLITDLSKISGLFVIARKSVFTYKGKPWRVDQISRELGVRYLLEGSVRRSGKQVRVNTQLIDATTGGHLWAERYDREFTEIFSLQDEITERIVRALALKLVPKEKERILQRETDVPEAYDLVLRGWAYFRQYSKETNSRAKQLFQRAIELDTAYPSASIGLVWTMLVELHLGWSQDPQVPEKALELASKLVALNESLPAAHVLLGNVYLWRKQYDKAVVEFEKAISLDPNNAEALVSLGSVMNFVGKPEEAIGLLKKAIRLNPHYPEWYILNLGRAYFQAGLYSQAIPALKEALLKNPDFPPIHYYLAASYGNLDRLVNAREKAEEIKRLRPNYRSEIEKEKAFYKYEKDLNRFVEGLRKAGLPE